MDHDFRHPRHRLTWSIDRPFLACACGARSDGRGGIVEPREVLVADEEAANLPPYLVWGAAVIRVHDADGSASPEVITLPTVFVHALSASSAERAWENSLNVRDEIEKAGAARGRAWQHVVTTTGHRKPLGLAVAR